MMLQDIRTEGGPGGPYGLAVSEDGRFLYAAMRGMDELQVIDLFSGTVAQRIGVGAAPIGVAVTPGGKQVLVANSRDKRLTVITFLEE